ncbi:hypothetical protein IP88_15810 [alpha proteobacterium AAP81b]|nr:hypothetical protein IP88_15810 [alpha proteobacterium AAP81b]
MATKALRNSTYIVPTYEGDFAAWAHHQAMLLRAGQLHLLDKGWLAEEIDDLGREQYHRLESALRLILTHLLKWDHQPERRSRSWSATIRTQRRHAERQLQKNPSLQARLEEAVTDAYGDARGEASGETDLPLKVFPENCPYDWDTIMARSIEMPDE